MRAGRIVKLMCVFSQVEFPHDPRPQVSLAVNRVFALSSYPPGVVEVYLSMLAHFLGRNRLHVFPNHLEIAGLEVAKVSPKYEDVAGVAEREVRLVLETHTEI
jgi:hypothetical protein